MAALTTIRRRYIPTARATRMWARPLQFARRPIVLMVEDDADDRLIYGTILDQVGFDVLFADDYESGLQAAQDRHPDAMLVDIGLPGAKTGLDLCLDLRRRHDTADLPVVVLSGFAERRVGEAARAAGCSAYIEKPTSPLVVARELQRLLAA